MSRLLTLKQSIATLEDLGLGSSDDEDDDESDFDSEADGDDMLLSQLHGLAPDELSELLADLQTLKGHGGWNKGGDQEDVLDGPSIINGKKKKVKEVQSNGSTEEQKEPPKKKRKTERKEKSSASSKTTTSMPIFDLEEPEFPVKSSRPVAASTDADAFGEFTTLQLADAQDKAARKRSLRFHTSKIESAGTRRERARTAMGGDDDIPWKDRKKEKDERLKKAVEKSRGQGGEDLDDEEPVPRAESSSNGKKRRRDDAESASDDEDNGAIGYYDLVQRKSKERKEEKKAEYEFEKAAAR
jgi:U3 small nucleolar RNA-associated protein 3